MTRLSSDTRFQLQPNQLTAVGRPRAPKVTNRQATQVAFCVRGVVSPLLSKILLTPFDKEMRRQGYQLTRWADDWVVTCRSRAEAEHALARAVKILEQLGVMLNQAKTRIVCQRRSKTRPLERSKSRPVRARCRPLAKRAFQKRRSERAAGGIWSGG